jgi:hypothetical protein
MVICSELQNLIFDRKEVNPGALRASATERLVRGYQGPFSAFRNQKE